MAKFIDKNVNLTPIFKHLEDAKQVNQDGKATYVNIFLEDIVSTLDTYLDYSRPLPEAVRHRLLTQVLLSKDAAKPITRELLLKGLNTRESNYSRQSEQKYYLATSVSFPSNLHVKPFVTESARIRFLPVLPKRYKRQSLEDDFKTAMHDVTPQGYSTVIVGVKARSPEEAFDRAMWEFDYVRGILNFTGNRGSKEIFTSGLVRPINRFCPGQVHTLHDSSGNLAVKSYWYNPSFVHAFPNVAPTSWSRIKKNEARLRRRVNLSRYAPDLRAALVRYARALDLTDHEAAFVKLWSLLEFLTNCDGNYDVLVRRCTWLFSDYDYSRLILQHLRHRRNLFVHAALESSLAKALVFELKFYVEQTLLFHIARKFLRRDDAASFLDSPYEPALIRARMERLKMALRFRTGGNKESL